MHIVVVVNGELPSVHHAELTDVLSQSDVLVAVDGGLVHCAHLGVWPSVLIGDLDSAPAALIEEAKQNDVQLLVFPANKDATDLELALEFASDSGATEVTVVAAFGGRLDHELATIALMASDRWRQMRMTSTDGQRLLHVVRTSCTLVLTPGQTVSLVPWHADVTGVVTSGLEWPLRHETLALGSTRGVSNVANEPTQHVHIDSGVLLVISDSTSR